MHVLLFHLFLLLPRDPLVVFVTALLAWQPKLFSSKCETQAWTFCPVVSALFSPEGGIGG